MKVVQKLEARRNREKFHYHREATVLFRHAGDREGEGKEGGRGPVCRVLCNYKTAPPWCVADSRKKSSGVGEGAARQYPSVWMRQRSWGSRCP